MKRLILLLIVALIMSGCSVEELFSLVARSDVEQAAGDQLDYASDVIVNKRIEMDALVQMHTESAELSDVTDEGNFGMVGRTYDGENGFRLAVLAVMPFPEGETYYQGWIVMPGIDTMISVGKLRATPDGQALELEYRIDKDYRSYSQVVVTLESVDDEKPELRVLEGSF